MLALLLILASQIVTPPSGPSLIAPGGNMSAPSDPACEIAGNADCQMTGQIRLQAGGTSPQLTWHGTDGWGTASNFGVSKVTNNVQIFANRAPPNYTASFGDSSVILNGNYTVGAPQQFIACYDGAVGEYCDILSGSGSTSYFQIFANVRLKAGTAAAPSLTFTGDLDTGFYAVTGNTIGATTGGAVELLISGAGITPGASGGGSLGTASVPWASVMTLNGTPSAPAYSFGGATDAGLYHDGSNLYLHDNTGSVGITAAGAGSDIAISSADRVTLTPGAGSTAIINLPAGADFIVSTVGAQATSIVDMSDTEQFRMSSYISTSGAVLSSIPGCSAANEGAQIYVKGTDTYAQKPPPYADLDSDLCICAEYHGTLVWASVLAPQYGCGVGTAP